MDSQVKYLRDDERRAVEELRRERSMFDQLMNAMPDKIFFKDLEGRFIRIGKAQVAQFGLNSPDEAIGKTDFDFFTESYARETQVEESEIIRTGMPMVGKERKLVLSGGTDLWVSVTKVPLRDPEGSIIGTVGISRDISDRKRAEEKLLRKNAEMQADLKMAYEVQQSFLTLQYPDLPPKDVLSGHRLRFNHCYFPVSTLAGDFFEIFRVSNSQAGILVCDVMGHGVRAALITAFLRGLIGEIMTLSRHPGAFLDGINRGLLPVLRQADAPMFVTAFYGLADLTKGEIVYANAGHPLPFVLRRGSGEVSRIAHPSADPEPALGLIDAFAYSSATEPFGNGDMAVLFTDGLFEVENSSGEAFGEDRLQEELRKGLASDSKNLIERVTGAAKRHADSSDFTDDVCIVAVECVESEG